MEIGRTIIHLNVVDSTNNYTANLVKGGEIDSGTVILADNQTDGRGQRHAKWSVKPGENLTFSLYLDNVNLSVDRQFVMTQFVSLCLVELLTRFGLEPIIKWPNDIYCSGKKISGVLIENQLMGKFIKSSIVGIGVNLNQEEFDGFIATSTYVESGKYRKPIDVVHSFCALYTEQWNKYMASDFVRLNEDYLSRLYRLNIESNYSDESGDFVGVIRNVLDSGKLVVEINGKLRDYELKEIQFKP